MRSVSVILPFYNAEEFIYDTLMSVINQTYKDYELICINDGSSDKSEDIVRKVLNGRGIIINQQNSGISASRNRGLLMAEGKYILFLDSDDILSPDFIEKRVACMEQNAEIGFCGSKVFKIDEKGNRINGYFRGISNNVNEEIFLYKSDVITCPSNYMIRKKVLIENHILFNTKLSSSADRFFLIELSKYCKGGFINEGGELYYRVHSGSMSHHLTPKLVNDNHEYLKELKRYNYIPEPLKKSFLHKINYILAGSNFKLRQYGDFVLHALKAVYYDPQQVMKKLINPK